MSLKLAGSVALLSVALLAGPVFGEEKRQDIPKQESQEAQKEMPTVGKETSTGKATPELEKDSSKAQSEMPAAGQEATTGKPQPGTEAPR